MPLAVGPAPVVEGQLSAPPYPTRVERLSEAYRQYDLATQSDSPTTATSLLLARARLDLAVLLLNAAGPEAELPDVVQAQLERDAKTVFAGPPKPKP